MPIHLPAAEALLSGRSVASALNRSRWTAATASIRSAPGSRCRSAASNALRTRPKVLVVEVAGYAYLVPFVEEKDHFFLKSVIPGRKATRTFIGKESDDV